MGAALREQHRAIMKEVRAAIRDALAELFPPD